MTISSAGQPPWQAEALQPPHELATSGLVNRSNSFSPWLSRTRSPSICAKYKSVSNR